MKATRKTTAKVEILELLGNAATALSHKEIQAELGALCNRVTIYRVLERLLEEGFIHRIINTDGVVKYARCQQCKEHNHQHNHVHFSCTQCQELTCLQQVQPSYQLPPNYLAQEVHFTISGICPNCLES